MEKRNVFNTTLLICSLTFHLLQTYEAFTLNGRRHTHIYTHTHVAAGAAGAPNNKSKKVIRKKFAPFTDCISKINNTEVDHGKNIEVVMSMYNLIKYNSNYPDTSGSLWQYYRDELALNNDGNNFDISGDNSNGSLKFKTKITGKTGDSATKILEY